MAYVLANTGRPLDAIVATYKIDLAEMLKANPAIDLWPSLPDQILPTDSKKEKVQR